ncbi:MAG: NAD(P)-binding domain-containing protein [Pseudomonadota bacterium]
MKIGIIGSGNMGRALGVRLAHLGHEVMFGARRREQAVEAAQMAGHGASAGDTDAAARFGDILIWTIRAPKPEAVFDDPAVLDGKILVDLNNRDYANDVKNGAWFDVAIAEALQEAAPGARVVKALNTIAMESFDTSPERLRLAGAQTFLAGDDEDAKRDVGDLVEQLGFTPVDFGRGGPAMRAVEALGDAVRLLMIDGARGGRAHLAAITLPDPDLETIGGRQSSSYR